MKKSSVDHQLPAPNFAGKKIQDSDQQSGRGLRVTLLRLMVLIGCIFPSISVFAQPTISGFSPATGIPGSTITISGSGFNTTPANNLVYFGATKASVTGASATALTVTVPTGSTYMPITAFNTATGLSASSRARFLQSYNNTPFYNDHFNFEYAVPYTTSNNVSDIVVSPVIADIDGDGKPDVIVVNKSTKSISVLRNVSSAGPFLSGSFVKTDFSVDGTGGGLSSSPAQIRVADIDGDGKRDIAVANGGFLTILRNTSTIGTISFASPIHYTFINNDCIGLEIGDFDSNGKPDIITSNIIVKFRIFSNNSTPGSVVLNMETSVSELFAPISISNVGDIVVSDFDGDNKLDFAIKHRNIDTDYVILNHCITICKNTMTGGAFNASSFTKSLQLIQSQEISNLGIADIDGDGKTDITASFISTSGTANKFVIYRNNSVTDSMRFVAPVEFATDSEPCRNFAFADFNGDGKTDIAVSTAGSYKVRLYRNTATLGTISATSLADVVELWAQTYNQNIAAADLNGDNYPDLVGTANTVLNVLGNAPFVPSVPVGCEVNPVSAYPGDTVTITGTGFNTTSANNTVYFGPAKAAVASASATQLRVIVPLGATHKTVSVFNTSTKATAFTKSIFRPGYNNTKYVQGKFRFGPRVEFTAATTAATGFVTMADLDGDNKPEAISVNNSAGTISIFRNTGSGTISTGLFAAKVDFSVGSQPYNVAIADFDGDGKPDIAVSNSLSLSGSSTVTVLRNTTTTGVINSSSFAAGVSYSTGKASINVIADDIDVDGKIDLIVANQGAGGLYGTVSVLRNTATSGTLNAASFQAAVNFHAGSFPNRITTADLNGDGRPEILAANEDEIFVFQNTTGTGVVNTSSFIPATALPIPITTPAVSSVQRLKTGDIDGDGKKDIIVSYIANSSLHVWRNLHSGGLISASSFSAREIISTNSRGQGIDLSDIDGDGNVDVVFGNGKMNNAQDSLIVIRRNLSTPGTNNFAPFSNAANSGWFVMKANSPDLYDLTVCDLDNDTIPDVVAITNNKLNIFKNMPIQNRKPRFTAGASAAFSYCQLTGAAAINSYLQVHDSDAGQTLSWTLLRSPANGTVVTGSTALATTTNVTPAGNIYTANDGFSGNDTFSIVVNDGAYLGLDTLLVYVTVGSALPSISGTLTLCGGGTTTLTNPTTGGTWSSSATTIATIGSATGVVAGKSGGTAIISYATTPTCRAMAVLTVNPPVAITGSASVLLGTTKTLTNASPGGIWSSSNAAIASIGSTTGIVTGVGSGTVTISYTIGSCYVTAPMQSGNYCTPSIGDDAESLLTGSYIYDFSVAGASGTSIAHLNTGYGGSGVGYQNATTAVPPVSFAAGSSYTVTLRVGTENPLGAQVWIDFGQDGVFSASEIIGGINSLTGTGTFTVTIPADAPAGTFRMRINAGYPATYPNINPCVLSFVGETHDYTATILSGCTPPAISCSGNVTATAAAGLCTTNVSYSAASATGSSPVLTYSQASGTAFPVGVTTVTATATNTCGTATCNFTVAVTAAPDTVVGADSLCPGSATAFSTTIGGGTWSSSNASAGTVSAGGMFTAIAAGTTIVTYTATTACATVSATKTIVVKAAPGMTGANVGVCNGSSTTLTASGASTYSWAPATGLSSTTGANVTASPTTLTNYTVTGTTNGCSTNAIFTVSVNPVPAITLGTHPTVSISATGADLPIAASTGSPTLYSISFSAPALTFGFSNVSGATISGSAISIPMPATSVAGVYTGTLTVATANCTSGTYTFSVTISETIVPLAASQSQQNLSCFGVCNGTASVTVSGGTPPYSYSWLPSGGSAATASGLCAGTYTCTTTDADMNTISRSFTITQPAALVLTAVGNSGAACTGDTVQLSCTPTGGTSPLQFEWSGPNGFSATNQQPSIIADTATDGTYTISVSDGNECAATGTNTTTVTLLPQPFANPVTGTTTVCTGNNTTLAAGGTSAGTWSSSNTSVATITASGIVTGITAGTSVISYIVTNACGTAGTATTVSVLPAPSAATVSGIANICTGSATTLTASLPDGSWTSSNTTVASVNTTGSVTGIAAGTAVIFYTLTNSCGSATATRVVTVNAGSVPATVSGASLLCAGSQATYTISTTGGVWSSSNPAAATISPAGVLAGINGGVTTVSYTVSNACGTAAATQTVTVSPLPGQPDSITGPSAVCAGGTITLSGPSGGTWSSSNITKATVNSSGVATGIATGVATISYTVSNACGSRYAQKSITINAAPATISGVLTVCPGAITTLTNSPGGGTWSSMDTTVSVTMSNGKVTGITPGTATVNYNLPAGCSTSVIVTVTPMPGPVTGTLQVCPGSTTTLAAGATGGTWSSSSVSKATVDAGTGVVTGINTGIAVITYTQSAGCFATASLTVNAAPAAIGGAPATCPGSSTQLTSTTAGGIWTSSNTSIATVNAATGLVTSVAGVGTTSISYTITGQCPRAVVVSVAAASPNAGTPIVCLGQPFSVAAITNATPGGTWSSSDPSIAPINQITGLVKGLTLGTVTITYQLGSGCISTSTLTVNPAVAPIIGDINICPGSSTTLSNTTPGGTWSSTNTSVAVAGTGGSFAAVFEGTSTISYIVNAGCYKSTTLTVYGAMADIAGNDVVCQGSSATLTCSPAGGTWTSNNTNASVAITTGQITGVATGTSVVSYKNSSTGCYTIRVITINPSVAAITGTANICPGATLSLSNADAGGTWSTGNPGVATIDATSGLLTGVGAGTAVITYTTAPACYRTMIQTIKTVPTPIGGASSVCQSSAATLTSTPAGGTWSSSDNSLATINSAGSITGISPGVITVAYTGTNGCVATKDVSINVNPGTITGTPAICQGSTSGLGSSTLGGLWSSSNNAKAVVDSMSGIVTAISQGTANITYMLPTGCFRRITATVNPLPAAITGPATLVQGTAVNFTSTPAGGTWSSTNLAAATVIPATGRATGIAAGTTTLSYQTTAGCAVTRVISIVAARGVSEEAIPEDGVPFRIYPNPTTGVINIETAETGVLLIGSVDGKIVAQFPVTATATAITLPPDLSPGVYVCYLSGANGTVIVGKLVYQP